MKPRQLYALCGILLAILGLISNPKASASEPFHGTSQQPKQALVILGYDENRAFDPFAIEFTQRLKLSGYNLAILAYPEFSRIFSLYSAMSLRTGPKDTEKPTLINADLASLRNYLSTIQQLDKQGKLSNFIVGVFAHGLAKKENETSHRVSIYGSQFLLSLDELQKTLTQLQNSENQTSSALIDFSCFSGASLALQNARTCVIAGAPDKQVGLIAASAEGFQSTFIREITSGQQLLSAYTKARALEPLFARPAISSPLQSTKKLRGFEKILDRTLDMELALEDPIETVKIIRDLRTSESFSSIIKDILSELTESESTIVLTQFHEMNKALATLYKLDANFDVENQALEMFQSATSEDIEIGPNQTWSLQQMLVFGLSGYVPMKSSLYRLRSLPIIPRVLFELQNFIQLGKMRSLDYAFQQVTKNPEQFEKLKKQIKNIFSQKVLAQKFALKLVPLERAEYEKVLLSADSNNICSKYRF